MGADLYIDKLFDERNAKYQARFERAVEKRNANDAKLKLSWQLSPARVAHLKKLSEKLQKTVERAYDAMYGGGVYFRDSYNRTNLYNLFGLSWWQDFSQYLDSEGHLSVENAKRVLADLKMREKVFNEKIQELELVEDETREQVVDYFKWKYGWFKRFLNKAIKTGNFVRASI